MPLKSNDIELTEEQKTWLKGWRACEAVLQTYFRTTIANEASKLISGFHVSWSDEQALKRMDQQDGDN